jgi:DNA-directed RNA polymerase subunit N (RpoN/RPB10)
MRIPPRCLSCGEPIGAVAFIYRAALARYNAERRARDPDGGPVPALEAHAPARDDNAMTEILAALRIDTPCCRTTLITTQHFDEHYR